ncbi:DNA-3-methyladenine glycosylase I [Corynebacterium pyruviciproducens]
MHYKLQPTVSVLAVVAVLAYLFAPAGLPLLFTGAPAREAVTVGDEIPLPASPQCERDFGSGMLTGYKCGTDYVRSAELGGIKDPALAATRLWRAEVYLPTDNRPTTEAVALREQGGLPQLVWSHAPASWEPPTPTREPRTFAPEAAELAADLKKVNFTFVGPTTCFALMEACGLVDNRIHE